MRELENVKGVMPSVPWAPKRSRDRAQHGRAAGRGVGECRALAYVGRACVTKDAFRA